jgi:phosphatidylglycerol:prolipoprotein diacylglycerol transferase
MYQYLDLGHYIKIPIYNLMIGIGIIFGVLVLEYQNKKNGIKHVVEIDLYIGITMSTIFGFLGAKIFVLLYNKQNFTINNIINSGMTYYGGLIFGIILFTMYNFFRRNKLLNMFNMTIPSIILVHAFGRIGCFLGGCCFGKPTNSFIGVIFPNNSIPYNFYEGYIKIFPTQLFESLFLFFLFIVIKKYMKFNYSLITYFIFYGLFRFFIENLRGDNRGSLFNKIFSPSQIISVFFILLGITLFMIIKNEQKRALKRGLFRLTGL